MAVKIQHKRGSKAALPALDPGEFGLATDTGELFVGGQSGNLQVPVLGKDGKVPAAQLPAMDYVPTTRKVNNKALSADITLNAGDVGAIPTSQKGVAGGVATLDGTGKIPVGQIPAGDYITSSFAIYTESGTFTPTSDINATVICVGGGGAGGDKNNNSDNRGGSGGGGSGGVKIGTILLTKNTPYTITIGAGGTSKRNGSGGSGGKTTIASGSTPLLEAGGGSGGKTNSGSSGGAGGNGGDPGGSGGGGGGAYSGSGKSGGKGGSGGGSGSGFGVEGGSDIGSGGGGGGRGYYGSSGSGGSGGNAGGNGGDNGDGGLDGQGIGKFSGSNIVSLLGMFSPAVTADIFTGGQGGSGRGGDTMGSSGGGGGGLEWIGGGGGGGGGYYCRGLDGYDLNGGGGAGFCGFGNGGTGGSGNYGDDGTQGLCCIFWNANGGE